MTKSQFNIKIKKDLLTKVKRQAMMLGKSLTEHITDLVIKSLSENDLASPFPSAPNKIKDLEERLLTIESIVSNREYLSEKLIPFNDLEALNCTNFMKGIFETEVIKRNIEDKNKAFDDFFIHLKAYVQLDQFPIDRLKEIMLTETPNPWTAEELNDLVGENKLNCPIRKGLINWTGNTDCPSQQEICDKGEKLLTLI